MPSNVLQAMDRDRIERGLLFPSAGLYLPSVQEDAYAAALCRAYNNWLYDYCGDRPQTLDGRGADPRARCQARHRRSQARGQRAGLQRHLRPAQSGQRAQYRRPLLRPALPRPSSSSVCRSWCTKARAHFCPRPAPTALPASGFLPTRFPIRSNRCSRAWA